LSVSRYLLDANLSPETAEFLRRTFGFDVVDLFALGLSHLTDREIVAMAKREARVVITFDLDFGKIYHRWERGQIGAIVLRLEDQTVESVNRTLGRFFANVADTVDLEHSLVVMDETRVRITTAP
jgi:predicted nuclease of predicted toxin-antitoxin system